MKFRLLREDEIEVRVGTVNETGCSLLLYKNARCDMNILDETVGAGKWQRRHYECKGNLFCSVGIFNGTEWIWKDDCGSESNAEKEKGEASDSFKRACVNWGIGRELYTAPRIWLTFKALKNEEGKPLIKTEQDKRTGRLKVKDDFYVERIAYDESNRIGGLAVRVKKFSKDIRVFEHWDGKTTKGEAS